MFEYFVVFVIGVIIGTCIDFEFTYTEEME